jgi:hypothetical protein
MAKKREREIEREKEKTKNKGDTIPKKDNVHLHGSSGSVAKI